MTDRIGEPDPTDAGPRDVAQPEAADPDAGPLPDDVLEAAERVTRHERNASVAAERERYVERRDQLLEPYEYTARLRPADDVLVCHPREWIEDGTVQPDRIEDRSRAVEVPLDGADATEPWEVIDERNRAVADRVRDRHGAVHGDTASALADFASNHLAKPIEAVSSTELETFREEYFRRNAWPAPEQRAAIERSMDLILETAENSEPST